MVSDGEALWALDFADHAPRMHRLPGRQCGGDTLHPVADAGAPGRAMPAYFEGALAAPGRLAVRTGGTAFQREVWARLRQVLPGAPLGYGRLATEIGRVGASLAVGLANGADPMAIVVPCHRVIGADASLTGHGGGLHRKRWRLDHERRHG